MKTLQKKRVTSSRDFISKKEMAEIEKAFVESKGPFYTLQETIEMARNENLHKDRR